MALVCVYLISLEDVALALVFLEHESVLYLVHLLVSDYVSLVRLLVSDHAFLVVYFSIHVQHLLAQARVQIQLLQLAR